MRLIDRDFEGDDDLAYGPPLRRPARASDHTAGSPIRLMNHDDLQAANSRRSQPGSLTIPCTPLVEVSGDGALLRPVPYRGLTLSEQDRRRGVLVVGATGARKTYGFALPTLHSLLRTTDDSLVTSNVKGPIGTEEIREVVAGTAPEAEFLVFAPMAPERTLACNLLQMARAEGLVPSLVRYIATSCIERGRNDSPFFEHVSRRLISAVLAHRDVSSLAELAQICSSEETLRQFATSHGDRVLLSLVTFLVSGSNGATSWADLAARLMPFSELECVRATTSGVNELNLLHLLQHGRRFVLVLELSEVDLDDARHVLGLFLCLLFGATSKASTASGSALKRPLTLLLDEFGVLPRIHDLPRLANLGRSRGLSLILMVQSVEQIVRTYGDDATSLLAGLCTKIMLSSGLASFDRDFASRLVPNMCTLEWRESQQLGADGGWETMGRTAHRVLRPLIAPEDLVLEPHKDFGPHDFVFPVDRPPAIVHLTPSWEIPAVDVAILAARSRRPEGRATPLASPEPLTPDAGLIGTPAAPNGAASSRISPESARRLYLLMKPRLEAEVASNPAAQRWWSGIEQRMAKQPRALLRLVRVLRKRKVSIIDLFRAVVASDSPTVGAALHYMEYQRLRRKHG